MSSERWSDRNPHKPHTYIIHTHTHTHTHTHITSQTHAHTSTGSSRCFRQCTHGRIPLENSPFPTQQTVTSSIRHLQSHEVPRRRAPAHSSATSQRMLYKQLNEKTRDMRSLAQTSGDHGSLKKTHIQTILDSHLDRVYILPQSNPSETQTQTIRGTTHKAHSWPCSRVPHRPHASLVRQCDVTDTHPLLG